MEVRVLGSTCSGCGARGIGAQGVIEFSDTEFVPLPHIEPFPLVMDEDEVRYATSRKVGVLVDHHGKRCGCEARPLVEVEPVTRAASTAPNVAQADRAQGESR